MENYFTIKHQQTAEIEVKKSKFITDIFPLSKNEDVIVSLENVKKMHYKANHHTYAYALGENGNIRRCSDDGEPSGTAGKPILNVIEKNHLTNILIVVTRYFGGIKLGASGLIRAYAASAEAGLTSCTVIKKYVCDNINIVIEYSLYGKLQAYLSSCDCEIYQTEFTDNIDIYVYIPEELSKAILQDLIALTNANITINVLTKVYREKEVTGK